MAFNSEHIPGAECCYKLVLFPKMLLSLLRVDESLVLHSEAGSAWSAMNSGTPRLQK